MDNTVVWMLSREVPNTAFELGCGQVLATF